MCMGVRGERRERGYERTRVLRTEGSKVRKREGRVERRGHISVFFLVLILLLTSCYRERTSSRFQLDDTLMIADTLTQVEQDSLSFLHTHHYSENFNFIVRSDSLILLRQLPAESSPLPVSDEEVTPLTDEMETQSSDSFAVYKNQELVVADIHIIPADSLDSVWVQVATENFEFGWAHEKMLLENVDPNDPISQFISIFSDMHTLIFLVIIILIGVGYLLRKLLKRNAKIVHFNDIDSFYPMLLALIVASSATFYASIQMYAPEAWRAFYFHPSLNPFSQPLLLGIFLASVWAMLIIGIAALDDTVRHLRFNDAFLYLCGLAAVCAFNYILFSISTLYYVGYFLLFVYVVFAIRAYIHRNPHK